VESPFDNSKDFDQRMDTGGQPLDVDFLFLGAGTPFLGEKPLDTKPAEVKRPYYLGMEQKLSNPYPQLAKIMAESEMDPDERDALVQDHLEALGVESPEQFGTKYKGKLEEMAQEHGIGDLLGYSFRSRKIEVIGSDKILLIDYDLNPLHARQVYGIESVPSEPEDEMESEEEEAEETEELEEEE
jgi:hypothetical protein